jgi:hypothetical protein
MLNDIELIKNRNISQHNLLNHESNYRQTNTNEEINEELNDDNKKCCENKKKNNYVIIPLHLILHIILLSIFEIVLYFHFITKIENQVFLNKVEDYLKDFNINNRINEPIISQILNYELNSQDANQYYDSIKNNYEVSLNKRNLFNEKLEKESYLITYILIGVFILYTCLTIFKYKLNIKKLIVEHLILIICIGLYEIWFFFNVILKYKLIDSDEINYTIISCLLKKLNNEPNIHINSTLINSCYLL